MPAQNASYLFYALSGQGLDVQLSGGLSPNTYPSPLTEVGIFPGGGSGGGGGGVTAITAGQGINVNQPTGNVTVACDTSSASQIGCAKPDNATLSAASDGTYSCNDSTPSQLGCSKPDNSTITDTAGTYSCATSTPSQLGCSKPDNTTITDASGTYSCTTATLLELGCVKPDGTTITIAGGVLSAARQTVTFEHNGTPLPNQNTWNALDIPPALPAGYQPCTWGTDSLGGIGCWVPPVLSSFHHADHSAHHGPVRHCGLYRGVDSGWRRELHSPFRIGGGHNYLRRGACLR